MILSKSTGIIMGPITYIMGLIFNAIYNFFNNMGVESIALSIVVFTILVRLIIFPLSLKTTKSSKIQQYLKPEFDKINKKYKGKQDQQDLLAKQRETQELQSEYGLKMSSGCLVSLLQFPVFIGLYNVIQNIPSYVTKIGNYYKPIAEAIIGTNGGHDTLVEFATNNSNFIKRLSFKVAEIGDFTPALDTTTKEGSQIFGRIVDIIYRCNDSLLTELGNKFSSNPSVAEAINANRENIETFNKFIFNINLSEAPGLKFSPALLIPIASALFQLLSMLLMPSTSTGDPQQDAQMQTMKRTMYIMPVMSFVVTVSAPAGLGLYWAVSALITCLITLGTNAYYDHADMEKIVEKAKEKAAVKNAKRKASGKKSFYEKMMEGAYGNPNEAEESRETNKGYGKIANMNLKNFETPAVEEEVSEVEEAVTEAAESAGEDAAEAVEATVEKVSSEKKQPRKGSLADKVNAVKRFNDSGDK